MKIRLVTLLTLFITYNTSFSQDKIKADVDIMAFLGRVPQKSLRNSLPDKLIRLLYYRVQPENYPKTGYLNRKGEILVQPEFNLGSDFYGNYANIIRDSTYGYIDKEGNETLLKNYDETFFYYGNTGIAKKNGKYGLINREGDSITHFKYTMISNFGFTDFQCQITTKKSDILNSTGKIIFNSDLDFHSTNHYFNSDSILIYQKDIDGRNLKGIFNIKGEILTGPEYQEIYFIDDQLFMVKKGNKFGFINKVGTEVIPVIYDQVGFNINEGLIPVQKNGKWGYINRQHEEKIPFTYDEAYAFTDDRAFVKQGNFYGCIDKRNTIKVPLKFEKTGFPFFTEQLALYKKGEKYGFISKKGKVEIPAIYDKAFPYINGLAYVELNGKAGYINKNGKEVIPIRYKQLWFESEGIIRFAE